jgi:hypothetical protein
MHTTRAIGRLRGGDVRLWRIAALCGLLAAIAIAAVGPSPALAATKYTVCTYTSDYTNAGTDSDVFVRLYGTAGSSKWLELDNGFDNFERRQTDCFYFILPNLGNVYALALDVDCDECWRLDGIAVNGTWFPYYGWVPDSVQYLQPA